MISNNTGGVYGTTSYWGGTTSVASGTIHIQAQPAQLVAPKPNTPEQWLRSRVQEICDLVELN
jgi:hypothetical protein